MREKRVNILALTLDPATGLHFNILRNKLSVFSHEAGDFAQFPGKLGNLMISLSPLSMSYSYRIYNS